MTQANQPAPMVAEDLYEIHDDDKRYELVSGVLRVSEAPGWMHGVLQVELASRLAAAVRAGSLGAVVVETGFVLQRDPDTVRSPDVAFVRAGRMPAPDVAHRLFEGAPDLAVEVVSPNDMAWEVAEKVEQWLAGGALTVWVVDPRNRLVVVHTPDGVARVLRAGDTLDGGDVLPGFTLALAELFAPTLA